MSNKTISVYADALKRQEAEGNAIPTQESTSKVTWVRETSSDMSREKSRMNPRESLETQLFRFRTCETK